MAPATAIDQRDLSLKLLEAAFTRFNETGEKLEARYQALVQETEDLRAQLREKEKEVKRSEKLATLGETAAAIAHEVRNPLGAIKLFLSLLRRDVEGQGSALTLVDQIDTSITSLNHVVENILQFSRGKALTFAPVNVQSIVQEQIAQLAPKSAKKDSIRCELTGNPFLIANEVALRQIVHNLVLNSLQATRYEGQITITIADRDANHLELSIHDNGPGIPEKLIGTIFDPFVTSKNEGTGLGLAIVQQLVGQHYGSVTAENRDGALFTVVLPRRPHDFANVKKVSN